MRRIAPFLAASLLLAAGGCMHSQRVAPPPTRPVVFSNSQNYDSFVVRRTDLLLASGQAKNRSEAAAQAETDAMKLYGARTRLGDVDNGLAGAPAGSARGGLTLAELDATVAAMKQDRGH